MRGHPGVGGVEWPENMHPLRDTRMAALLVHDLRTGGGPALPHPWQDEAYGAAHGGLWRVPYTPRSALGLAVLLGLGGART